MTLVIILNQHQRDNFNVRYEDISRYIHTNYTYLVSLFVLNV